MFKKNYDLLNMPKKKPRKLKQNEIFEIKKNKKNIKKKSKK